MPSQRASPRPSRPGRLQRLFERWFGFVPVGLGWRLYRIPAAQLQRRALPQRVAIPATAARRLKSAWTVPHAELAGHAEAFARAYPRHEASGPLELFARKAPLAARIEAALREQRWGDAERDLRRVLELDPADAHAGFLTGVCRLRRGDLEGAGPCLEEAAARLAQNPDVHASRGAHREARGEIEQAKSCYRAALELDSGHPGALERLAALGEMVEIFLGTLDRPEKGYLPMEAYESAILGQWEKEAPPAAALLARSHHHLRIGQGRLALAAARRAEEALFGADDPALAAEVLAARCRASLALERFDDAREAADALAAAAPESAWAASCRGHLLWFTGDRTEAAAWIEKAIARDPNRVEDVLLYLRPEFPRAQREPLSILKRLEKQHPQSFVIQSVTASIEMARGRWDEGAQRAVEAARLGAGEDLLVELTGRLGREGRHEDVLRVARAAGGWERFLEGQALLRAHLAEAFDRAGHPAEARALWAALLEDGLAHPDLRLRARRALEGSASGEQELGAAPRGSP
ncbi:MAG: tetratricopeptide repeat protein [Candidatus Eisenbacteria bacterium]|uniref:Tetratricopeptide repeat protein n=1 Tax=Eiseniibacteriota bacterium TaxID=2212470 RepID=A0A937XCR5_UNCEI|nr:tetratricopeptide repeat protein [Candidatus Eisenbacteria bacterium]